jgi:AraC-like DNA-binding protein
VPSSESGTDGVQNYAAAPADTAPPHSEIAVCLRQFRESRRRPSHTSSVVNALLAYIHEFAFYEDLSVGTTLRNCRVKDHNASMKFAHEVGTSMKDYIEEYRLDAAELLLSRSGVTVASAAHAVGYLYLQTFYRAYRRRHEMPPRANQCELQNAHTVAARVLEATPSR